MNSDLLQRRHVIEEVSFHDGYILCSCGIIVEEPDDPAGDRTAGLISAWQEHRVAKRATHEPRVLVRPRVGFSLRSGATTRALR